MSIETVGSMARVLKTYDANQWIKSADLALKKPTQLIEGTAPNLVEHETKRSFSELLANSIQNVNSMQKDANEAIQRLATGKTKNIHETMLAVEQADIAFRSMNQIRTKVLDAYKEIMRMQV